MQIRGKIKILLRSLRRHFDSKLAKYTSIFGQNFAFIKPFEVKWLYDVERKVSIKFSSLLNVCEMFLLFYCYCLKRVLIVNQLNYALGRTLAVQGLRSCLIVPNP